MRSKSGPEGVLAIVVQALQVMLLASAPALGAALVTGLVVSVLQAAIDAETRKPRVTYRIEESRDGADRARALPRAAEDVAVDAEGLLELGQGFRRWPAILAQTIVLKLFIAVVLSA